MKIKSLILSIITALGLAASVPSASAQYTALVAQHIQGVSMTPLATGQFCLTPVSMTTLQPTSFNVGGGNGQVIAQQYCFPITAGSIGSAVQVADTAQATPSIGYLVRILNAQGIPITTFSQPIRPTGTTWNLDNWQPTTTSPILPPVTIASGTSAPSGTCTAPALYYEGSTIYACVTGSWTKASGVSTNTAVQQEFLLTSGGSQTYQHNLNSQYPVSNCFTKSGTSAYSLTPVDVNNITFTTPAATDTICNFLPGGVVVPDFTFTVTPATLNYVPSLSGTQSPTFSISQAVINGFTGAATYSTTSLPSGMSSSFSPASITGAGNSTLTVSFPPLQASGTTTFNVSASGGGHTHTNPVTLTISDINSNLAAGWAMTEGSGTTFNDATANADNLTIASGTGSWGTVSGLPGTVFSFIGNGAGAVGANDTKTNVDGTTPFSVSTWVTFTTSGSFQQFITDNNAATAPFQGWILQRTNGNQVEFILGHLDNLTNSIDVVSNGTGVFYGGTLHYVVVTYDGSQHASGVAMYVDGASVPVVVDHDLFPGPSAPNYPMQVGTQQVGAQAFTRFYPGRVLSPSNVAGYFTAGPR